MGISLFSTHVSDCFVDFLFRLERAKQRDEHTAKLFTHFSAKYSRDQVT